MFSVEKNYTNSIDILCAGSPIYDWLSVEMPVNAFSVMLYDFVFLMSEIFEVLYGENAVYRL